MNWYQLKSYFTYWKKAKTVYDIHSPFLYEFIRYVYDENRTYYDFRLLKEIRKMIAGNKGKLPISKVGAPSKLAEENISVPYLLKHVSSPEVVSRQLYRMNVYLQTKNALELGTCLGMNSLYLSKSIAGTVYTIEGHPPFQEFADRLFEISETKNVVLKKGHFQEVIPQLEQQTFDLIYIDGHHEYDATIEYTDMLYGLLSNKGVLVVADIHWSKGMEKAWESIRRQERFCLSMDSFYYGILWKGGFSGPKQHFVYLSQAWLKPWNFLKAI